MKASIIIPSYNSAERLYLNLVALNQQTYQKNDVEVIVVDNGSRDNTMEMLKNFSLKYPLKAVRVDKNQGIAYGRNQGIMRAEGDILIFHDSDMLASKNFIEKHLEYHEKGYTVVCGVFWKRIYSYFYSAFNPQQMEDFKRYGMHFWPNINYRAMNRIQLISDKRVMEGNLDNYSFDLELPFIKDLMTILRNYGPNLSGYYLPWRFFITNNLSVKKSKVFSVGLFDEKIVRYGYEDYDLGIRLYKAGNQFVVAEDIVSLHQEHPANYNYRDIMENINYICEKYNNIYFLDMLLVSMNEILKLDSEQINLMMNDIYQMLIMNSHTEMLELLLELLQMLRAMYFKPGEALKVEAVKAISQSIPEMAQKIKNLLLDHHFNHFAKLLCQALKLTLKIDLEPALGMSAINLN